MLYIVLIHYLYVVIQREVIKPTLKTKQNEINKFNPSNNFSYLFINLNFCIAYWQYGCVKPKKIMYTITQKQFNDKHKDLKGVWSSDFQHGTNYDGLKTLLHWEKGTCLIVETIHFKVVGTDKENINPIK